MTTKSFIKDLKQITSNDASLSIINWNGAGIGNVVANLLFRHIQHNTSAIVLLARYNEISKLPDPDDIHWGLSLIHISEHTRPY